MTTCRKVANSLVLIARSCICCARATLLRASQSCYSLGFSSVRARQLLSPFCIAEILKQAGRKVASVTYSCPRVAPVLRAGATVHRALPSVTVAQRCARNISSFYLLHRKSAEANCRESCELARTHRTGLHPSRARATVHGASRPCCSLELRSVRASQLLPGLA